MYLVAVAIIAFVVGYLLNYLKVPQIVFFNTAITSLFFYLLGNVFSVGVKNISLINKWIALLLGVCLLFGSQYLYEYNNCYIFYRNNELSAPIYMVAIVALFGIAGILFLSNFLSHIKITSMVLSYYGRNSLVILCAHLYVWKFIQFLHLPAWSQFLIIIICMIPAICFFKRVCPRLAGYQQFLKFRVNEEIAY